MRRAMVLLASPGPLSVPATGGGGDPAGPSDGRGCRCRSFAALLVSTWWWAPWCPGAPTTNVDGRRWPTLTHASPGPGPFARARFQGMRTYDGSLRGRQSVMALPPAADNFSDADAENACAETSSLTPETSPSPSTFTSWFGRTAPAPTRSSTPTEPPCGNRVASCPTLTTWKVVRNGFLNPFNFGSRMCNGKFPPSNEAGTCFRAPVPLV